MILGLVFPQTEIGIDPVVIRDYAQAAEQLGFENIAIYEHVVGAGRATRPDWQGVYDFSDTFHEPFVLLGYLAAVTTRIGLAIDVLVLPQRQTVLVAKQAAEADVLSGGRLRLGVGVGWNELEFVALGMDFHDRGKRVEEQIELLRALWTEEIITFAGRWHTIEDAGIKPLPLQRPIPIWLGGSSEATIDRVARLADGWFPLIRPDERARNLIERLRELRAQYGRAGDAVGISPQVNYRLVAEERMLQNAVTWRDWGATHLLVNLMGAGLQGAQHVEALSVVRELFRDRLGL